MLGGNGCLLPAGLDGEGKNKLGVSSGASGSVVGRTSEVVAAARSPSVVVVEIEGVGMARCFRLCGEVSPASLRRLSVEDVHRRRQACAPLLPLVDGRPSSAKFLGRSSSWLQTTVEDLRLRLPQVVRPW